MRQKTIIQWIVPILILLLGAAPSDDRKRVRVSGNGRFLMTEDGKPFFYLGDTAWELFHRTTKEEAILYLDNRKAKGFNVIQAVVLAELDGLHTPNSLGHTPLIDDDPTKPNEAYFAYVDWIIQEAAKRDMYIGLLPTWGDKVALLDWGVGPEIFTPQNARIFGEFLGKRYKNAWNIIWILGGDRNPRNDHHIEIWRNMAAGIITGVGSADRALMTFHPQPTKPGGSSKWFHNDDWLDFNMHQTGHCIDFDAHRKITHDYNLNPIKPTMDAEPIYEEHPICFNGKKHGFADALDIRRRAYAGVFYGGLGHTYGCAAIWQMYMPGRTPMHGPLRTWKESLDLPGAQQMRHLKNLILSRPFFERIPDSSLVVGDNPDNAVHVSATRSDKGRYALLYLAGNRSVTVRTGVLSGDQLQVWWYDPRTGKAYKDKKIRKTDTHTFHPPVDLSTEDWVLVLDDASAGFKRPGQTQ